MAAVNLRIHQHWSVREVLYRLTDGASLLGGWGIAAHAGDIASIDRSLLAASCSIILYYLSCEISGMYRNWRGVSLERELACSALTWSAALPLLITAALLSGYQDTLGPSFTATWYFAVLGLLCFTRLTLRAVQRFLRRRGLNTRGYAIVGVNDLGFQLARNIDRSDQMGLKLVGFFDDRSPERTPELPSTIGQRIGGMDELLAYAQSGQVGMIYITFPMRAEDRIKSVLTKLADTTASVYIVPDFFRVRIAPFALDKHQRNSSR